MANAKLSKVKLTPSGGSAAVTYDVIPMGFHYIAGTGTAAVTTSPYTFSKWEASSSAITELYDGLAIVYKIPVAGNGSYGTCLQINNLGYHPVVTLVNSMISTRYGVDSTILLVYNSSITGTVYNNSASSSTITGCWVCVNDYDSGHYKTHLYAGTGTAANTTATNGSVKLAVTDNTAVRDTVTLQGTGSVTVVSDNTGIVTINGGSSAIVWGTF